MLRELPFGKVNGDHSGSAPAALRLSEDFNRPRLGSARVRSQALTAELGSDPLPVSDYAETITLIERLHRRFLDVLRVELERLGIDQINNVQSLLLANIGDEEVSVGELMSRGYYLGLERYLQSEASGRGGLRRAAALPPRLAGDAGPALGARAARCAPSSRPCSRATARRCAPGPTSRRSTSSTASSRGLEVWTEQLSRPPGVLGASVILPSSTWRAPPVTEGRLAGRSSIRSEARIANAIASLASTGSP